MVTVVSPMPGSARVDLASAALVTVDVQRDVLDSGPLGVAGTAAAVPRVRRLAAAFRRAGLPVVHVVRLYRPDGSNAEPCRRALVAGSAAPVLQPGSAGAELAEGVPPPSAAGLDADLLLASGVQPLGPGEVALYKPRWGAFYNTPLEAHLRGLGVDTLVFCGANFPNCPRTSVYEASERDYRVLLAADATSGLYPRGVAELGAIGVGSYPTETIIGWLAAGGVPAP